MAVDERVDRAPPPHAAVLGAGLDVGEGDDLAVLDGEQDVAVAAEGVGEEERAAVLQVLADRGRRRRAGNADVLGGARRPAGREQQHRRDQQPGDDHRTGGHEQELGVGPSEGHGPRCTTQAAAKGSRFVVRHGASTTIPLRGSLRIPRQAALRAYGIPVSDGAPVTTVPEAVEVADRIGYPGRREGPGPGGRARQGRRHQARRQRRGGPHPRREHPRHGHQGPHGQGRLDREGQRHRRGVLRLLHARPGGQAPPRHALGPGRRRDRAGGGREPRRHRQDPRRPGRRPHRGAVPGVGGGGEARTLRPPRARSTS